MRGESCVYYKFANKLSVKLETFSLHNCSNIKLQIYKNGCLMKKLYAIVCIAIFAISAACGNASRKDENTATTDKKSLSLSSQKENFNTFFTRFNDDAFFQRNRVRFPIEAEILPRDYTLDESLQSYNETIDKMDWEHIDLTYDSSFMTRQIDQYRQDVRFVKDSAIVELRGIDNGIYANYNFLNIDGKWYLVSFTDISF